MTSMTIFLISITVIVAILGVDRLSSMIKVIINQRKIRVGGNNQLDTLNWFSVLLVSIAGAFVFFSFAAPVLFTTKAITSDFDFSQTGQIGDTVGGLMNPFITLAGVIVTGLAFYMQYKANLLQRELFTQGLNASNAQFQKQLSHQQFESQFYEMLKLHRANIDEMTITGYDFEETANGLKKFDKITQGRKVFVTMKRELECIIAAYSSFYPLDDQGFKKCYQLFFSGLDDYKKVHSEQKDFVDFLFELRRNHEEPNSAGETITTNEQRKKISEDVKLYFNYKPFGGHASRLGHYFRHLYLSVKSTVNSPIIDSYDEKMRYLRILRAQLSNHEQILLFYNWLGKYGESWEDNNQNLFTEFCMIHNLWHDKLFDHNFIKEKVEYLRKKPVQYRKTPMFEIG